ncbi:MAG: SDR family oxidoreductase [Gammaproteobacteria bacterium]|nr:SDR family oxidoreductase [Gammaproteobacteria bacterium]
MRILITGASGFIGSHLVQGMLQAGHQVSMCVRHPAATHGHWPGLETTKADFSTDHGIADWIPRLRQIDVVINTVGIIRESRGQTFEALHTLGPVTLFRACEAVGVRRVIQISALGADETAFSPYHLSKRAADRCLREMKLDWAVVMPSIVYGPGARSMSLFKAIAGMPLVPLIDKGEQQIQPIHVEDLTKAITQLVESTSPLRADISMMGPSPVSMGDLYTRLRRWLGLGRPRFLSIPYRVVLKLTGWGEPVGLAPAPTDAIRMLQTGNTANIQPFVSRFGFMPRSLDQALTATPAQQADRWYAGLCVLRPMLRLSIAFVWLFTGVISALVFPVEQSYSMLARVGIEGIWQPIMLYGAAITDIILGAATLMAFRVRLTALVQIGIILLYSVVITASLPEQWIHPFGALSKNLPLIVATLILMVLERENRWTTHYSS